MPVSSTDHLRMGLVGMSAAESALVATFFRLHRFEPSFIWSLVSEPPFDALLIDTACPAEEVERLKSRHTQLKRLGAPGQVGADEMPRPIRSDVLLHWLSSIEDGLLHGERDDFPNTVIEPVAETAGQALRVDETSVAPANGVRMDNALFKLRRWPSQSLLASDMNRIRIATMLSRREMSLQQLVETTGVAAGPCKLFLEALDRAGLISKGQSTPLQADADAESKPSAQGHLPGATSRGIGLSLLRSIRQRFGL